jgi:hypothetical protein
VKTFFQIEEKADTTVREKEPLEWYVKNRKLFIKTTDLEIKIQLFRKKGEILSLINNKLTSLGYKQTIEDIYTK